MEYPKEELKILAKANAEFFKRYMVSIVAGFGGAVYILKSKRIPLNSRPGYLSIFAGGLFGEYFGRVWGNNAEQRITSQLPPDSYLKRLKRGELEVSVGMDEKTRQMKVKVYPKGELEKIKQGKLAESTSSDISQNSTTASKVGTQKCKTNKYGDEIIDAE